MRISEKEAQIVKKLAARYFGRDCKVCLFGSRADDSRWGGDIDLYAELFTLAKGLSSRKDEALDAFAVR